MVPIKQIIVVVGLFMLTIPFCAKGQNNSSQISNRALYPISAVSDTIDEDDDIQVPGKGMDNNLDSLLSIWYVQRALKDTIGVILLDGEDMPSAALHDSIYIKRLSNLSSLISLPYNDIIRNHIVFYTQKMPEKMEMILGLSDYYLPRFEEILDLYGLPLELKVLPIIESALNPVAVSRVGATGMWQFMLITGRQYSLTINSFVDERRDPIASAHAAAQYLTDMYKIFNDWTLVIAAYNCGAGNVRKAIKRANGKTDYWEIYPYLPRETRGYVPAFIAATYAINYYREHKLTPKTVSLPAYVDTFMINKNLHFEQISDITGIPIDELRDLNPQYRKNIIPGKERPYELRIPFDYTGIFIEKEREVYGYKDSVYFNAKTIANVANASSAQGKKQISHRVKNGETLSGIADKYKVKLSDLRYWNNLTEKSIIHPKQKLIVYGSKEKPATANAATDKSTASTTAEKASTDKKSKTAVASTEGAVYYTVKQGETLWSISGNHDDVNFYDLVKINGLTEKSKLQTGQKIRIK